MRILITIGHSAHVHFFKNFVRQLEMKGHHVMIAASTRGIIPNLLNSYNFRYRVLGKKKYGLIGQSLTLIDHEYNLHKLARKYHPDILTGIGGVVASHIGKLVRKPSIIFTDTEHANLQNRIVFPFASVICTPSCFSKDLGKKQIRYNGYHELAYLHPNYFKPNPAVLDEMGLSKGDNIFLIRFAAFNASHDTKSEKFKKEYVSPLIKKLEKEGEVIISSEIKLDKSLRKYQYKLSPEKYHDVLYYSKIYVGESSTSAEEAAIMGVPSLHFERLNIDGKVCGITPFIGVLDELQNKYGLLYSYYNENELLVKVDEVLSDIDIIKEKCKKKREELLKDKIDVTAFMVWFIENYPESFKDMKENPEIQYRFRLTSKDGV